jgi:hypothetical protein
MLIRLLPNLWVLDEHGAYVRLDIPRPLGRPLSDMVDQVWVLGMCIGCGRVWGAGRWPPAL